MVAVSKGIMRAVKLCTNKILQFLTRGAEEKPDPVGLIGYWVSVGFLCEWRLLKVKQIWPINNLLVELFSAGSC